MRALDDSERRLALADFLRTRRERLSPLDVGLPVGLRRRTPGLRREEVALLANIGTSWYTSLEQGRDVHPSEQVLDSLSLALRLTPAERQYLFLLALQHTQTNHVPAEERASPALEQIIQALDPHPAYVRGRRWDMLARNRAAELIFPESDNIPAPHRMNLVWRFFLDDRLREHHVNWDSMARGLVARFRADSARYPGDPWFSELIDDLRKTSEPFCRWWSQHDVLSVPDCHKEINHQTLGYLEFQEVTLQVPAEPELHVSIYTATPETRYKLEQAIIASDKSQAVRVFN